MKLLLDQAQIVGKTIYFQFSSRSEVFVVFLLFIFSHFYYNTVGSQWQNYYQYYYSYYVLIAGKVTTTGSGSASVAANEVPSAILLVTILNALLPVTIENLHEIFRPYGFLFAVYFLRLLSHLIQIFYFNIALNILGLVMKIAMFVKTELRALVQV